jgi:hypothetical protein
MPTSDEISQAERRRVLRNDARVREQSRNGDTSAYVDQLFPRAGRPLLRRRRSDSGRHNTQSLPTPSSDFT